MSDRQALAERAIEIRRIAVGLIHGAESGHPGSCLSAADLIAALYFREMRLGVPGEAAARAGTDAGTAKAVPDAVPYGDSDAAPDENSAAADDRDLTIKAVPEGLGSVVNVLPLDNDRTVQSEPYDIDATLKAAPYDIDATVKAPPYQDEAGRRSTVAGDLGLRSTATGAHRSAADVGHRFSGAGTIRDRFVLSKGHACPALYAALYLRGEFDRAALGSFRRLGGLLQGSPTTNIPGIDATCGSLGQGFSIAVGLALGLRKPATVADARPSEPPANEHGARVFVMLGDGELQEGEIWEGAMAAGHYKLGNLCAIVDYNKMQSDDLNEHIMRLEPLDAKWRAFNWHVVTIDGHDFDEIADAFAEARATRDQPTVVIANTIKGKGVSYMEGVPSWHGSVKLKPEEISQALADLGVPDNRQPEYAFHV